MSEKNNKSKIAFSIVIAGLLIAIALIFFNQDKIKNLAGKELSSGAVAEKVIAYINDNFLDQTMKASLVEISDAGSVYKIRLRIEETEFDSFASKDGAFLFPEGYDLREGLSAKEPQTESSGAPEIAAEDLAGFAKCLQEAGFVIYGANWCGWTKQLVQMLGGWEVVSPIYVECMEEAELCQEKNVSAYPTILINNEQYQGERTFEGFSSATGCPAPAGSENQGAENPTGACQ